MRQRAKQHIGITTLVVILVLCGGHASAQQELENLEGLVKGVQVNVVEGQVSYQREGTFDLEAGVELKEGDLIKSGKNGRAEILLQPGNLLRIAEDTEVELKGDQYDRIRLRLGRGSISFELLKHELDLNDFAQRLESGYDLIRVTTPDAEVLALQPGIIRITVGASGSTEVAVRRGDAILNGQRVREKRVASIQQGTFKETERDSKQEDSFDIWCRTRAENLIQANKMLKKEAPWTKAEKDGADAVVDTPVDPDSAGSAYVISARPGTITFVESGFEACTAKQDWTKVDTNTRLESGARLRSTENSYVELTLLPDLYLRLGGSSEIAFEELSYESLSVRLLKGTAILDVPFFDKDNLPPIKIMVGQRSLTVADSGNYRFEVNSGAETAIIRDGKVLMNQTSIGSCRRITNGDVTKCVSKVNDTFDWWSKSRGEGISFTGRAMASRAARYRRVRQRSTGFWYHPAGVNYHTFVPFFSTLFHSPYGGNYASVLSPRRMRPFMGSLFGSSIRLPRGPVRQ
jgi:hypothetical protein